MVQGLPRTLAPVSAALALPLVFCLSALAQAHSSISSAAALAVAPMTPMAPPSPMINLVHVAPRPPATADATMVTGVNTAGTVTVNQLANLETVINWGVNTVEVFGVVWGLLCIYQGIKNPSRRARIALGLFFMGAGLAAPSMASWLLLGARACGGFMP